MFAARGAPAQTAPGFPKRFVDIIELADHEDQVDITVLFTCSLRYVTHMPASQGQELRIALQPMPDCGVTPGAPIVGELPPLSGGARIVAAARVDSDVPGQVTLVLSWRKPEQFVLAQGADPRGMRIRLLNRARGHGKVTINEPPDTVSNYAINLESQPAPFAPEDVTLAGARLKAHAYVSEAVVDGDKWYRLRIGPIAKRADAERILALAQPDYPRAWLAVGDDSATSDGSATADQGSLPAVEPIGADAAADPGTLQKMLADARTAIAARDYPTAITLLTKLQRQPEFPDRARAQELLGLARERSGQLAHAKAEYEEYLRRYPQGEAAERVAVRLHALRKATQKPRAPGEAGDEQERWSVDGGIAQLFRYDGVKVDNSVPPGSTTLPGSTQTTTQNALYNDVDMLAQRRGERFDMLARLSAGYVKSFEQEQSGDSTRLSVASIELADRSLGLFTRLGRQSRNQDGVLGTFDGLFGAYQWRPAWGANFTLGYPVEQTDDTVQTNRSFATVAVAYTPPGKHWDASLFFATQQFDGVRDRQAVGAEMRYLAPIGSLVALIDYDIFYQSLNAATLIGTVQAPDRWTLSFDLEHRNSPILTTRNALIGQPVTTIADMEEVFTEDQIFQLAQDRTPATSNFGLTATRPIGERYQFSAAVFATQTGATVASGGVEAQPATGLNFTYQTQLYASNAWRAGDFHVLSLTYADNETGKIYSFGWTSRFPIAGAWRLGPRFTIDRRMLATDSSTEYAFVPSLLVDYLKDGRLVQLEIGGQLGKRDALDQTQNTQRYYVSLAYRISF
ncbi:MAG TPA: SPOR domain-containing protein [Steroidobacteraceae bacterium]|nr:SPOR domain-containing protein [Steroidobacteraceae bacterium]